MRLKSELRLLSANISELLRILCMQVVLVPAAYFLPRSWALEIAKLLSLSLVVLPSPGWAAYRQMRQAFGQDRYRSFLLAWEWMARPFRDYVVLKRVLYGREDVSSWKIVEKNSDEVVRLRETGQSFIVATAHFQRAALQATTCPKVIPGNLIHVVLPPPKEIRSLYDLRVRIQYGTTLKVTSSAWRRPFEYVFVGPRRSAASVLFERIGNPGNIIYIHLDAPWPKSPRGSYSRPFAGLEDRNFSTGAARLALKTQCPIVSCVYWQENDGTIILKWGSPIERVDDEIDTMNRLIDTLEEAVGERPTQYMFDIGNERRWNAALKRWESLVS